MPGIHTSKSKILAVREMRRNSFLAFLSSPGKLVTRGSYLLIVVLPELVKCQSVPYGP